MAKEEIKPIKFFPTRPDLQPIKEDKYKVGDKVHAVHGGGLWQSLSRITRITDHYHYIRTSGHSFDWPFSPQKKKNREGFHLLSECSANCYANEDVSDL